jgi:hypothetical protein
LYRYAAAFGPASRVAASPALMAKISTAMSAGHTVMAWVRLDVVGLYKSNSVDP